MERPSLMDLDEERPPEYLSAAAESPVVCASCGFDIRDRFVLKVMGDSFHESCLRCSACQLPLSPDSSCFAKDGHIYCREDHAVIFGSKCGRCRQLLHPSDLVFRCVHNTFHQDCFSCAYCGVAFSKGDEYHVVEGLPYCRNDYAILAHNAHLQQLPSSLFDYDLSSDGTRKTPKRPRTILNATQRRQFKLAFEKSPKPCRKVREQLAKETGLSVRVVQVWFQNQRAKMKKQQKKEASSSSVSIEMKEESKSESEDELADSEGEETEERGGDFSDVSFSSSFPPPPVPITPIDKLYNMQHTYFSFV